MESDHLIGIPRDTTHRYDIVVTGCEGCKHAAVELHAPVPVHPKQSHQAQTDRTDKGECGDAVSFLVVPLARF